MSADDQVTTGEIYRRLCDMDERYERKLDRIEEQVRTTNGRTTKLESDYGHIYSAVRRLQGYAPAATPAVEPGESLSLRLSPKIWTVLAAAGGVLFAMVVEWVKNKMAKP